MTTANGKQVLISGASIAGLCSAYWMSELGYAVTVVEIASAIRTGGTAVNVRDKTIDIVRQMGILDAILANRLTMKRWDFKLADGSTARSVVMRGDDEPPRDDDIEIERDVLMRILYDAVKERCDMRFADSIVGIRERARMDVTFNKAPEQSFDLVLGCDGTHSGVRKLW